MTLKFRPFSLATLVTGLLLFLFFGVNYFNWHSNSPKSLASPSLHSIREQTTRGRLFFHHSLRSSHHVKLLEPVRKFAYIKTHKTGSTSLWYVLKIYAIRHQLRRVEPRDNVHLGHPKHLVLNSSRMYLQTHKVGEYDALYDHCRFNKSVMDKLLNMPIYFTILRDPITRYVSVFHFHRRYRQLRGKPSAGEVLSNIHKYEYNISRFVKWAGFNGMAFDLGVDPPYKQDDVEKKISELEESFSLVLIMEYMPESIVLLKRTLRWELDDFIALPQNSHPDLLSSATRSATDKYTAHHTSESLNEKQKETLAKLSHADMKIYRHFNSTFWRRIQGEFGFHEEVQLYKKKLERYLRDMSPEVKGFRKSQKALRKNLSRESIRQGV
ncbi:galactose-3-O-sulfotransferase 2-like [Oscarella lobularis]|uniref:galactose-3-O-sulfotransferase 2-like n=1 Tax=Oscarella lobularis TaxID=121494 RepID=UPI003313FA0B